jgi:hypothetical protein
MAPRINAPRRSGSRLDSYFPCAAAAALGHYADCGIDIEVVHVSPVEA